ncbi:MAG: hypothetical protein EBZ52_04585, partial [Actinobacteria bacterium]|nr:hypothetical protein [Actinomycetota bacterium]
IIASIIAALLVFAIAAVVIGREARRLDSVAPRVVYELEQATQFVADNLPSDTQARLTYAELRKLLVFHMRWLHDKGLQPAGVVDRRQDIVDEVVIDEQTLTAYLLDAAEKNFDAIGAIGPQSND